MPEGPSLIILKEKLTSYTGKTLTAAGGYTDMPTAWLKNKKLLEIKTWGKHLLLRFTNGTVRIHLMLFGSLQINKRKKVNASFYLRFGKDELNFYVVKAQKIEKPLDEIYDWRTDIMSGEWSTKYVREILKVHGEEIIADTLMNQAVFTGVGNIIRNEVLFRIKLHPMTLVKNIPSKVLTILFKEIRKYGVQFLKEKKAGTFGKHWEVYEQKECPRDGTEISKEIMGKAKRKTYYCTQCQVKYRG